MTYKADETHFVDYYAYIQSDEWRQKANQAKFRAGYRCQVCNRPSSAVQLDAHHRTYERLGSELPEDVTILCRDCHKLYELNGQIPRRQPENSSPAFGETRTPLEHQDSDAGLEHEVPEPLDDHKSEGDYAKHFLPRIGMLIFIVGAVAATIWTMAVELQLLLGDWFQIINPFFQITVFYAWITSPLSWQFAAVMVLGYGLMFLGSWIVSQVRPPNGMFRWFWRWKATAFIKVPVFLIVVWNSLYGIMSPFSSLAFIVAQQASVMEFPLILPVLRTYVILLPLPLLHLTWDNRFGHPWVKLFISISGLLLLAALGGIIEIWWISVLCGNSLMPSTSCADYAYWLNLDKWLDSVFPG